MTHDHFSEEAQERAALYALGLLEGDERRAFEDHLGSGCELCLAELRSFEHVVAQLPYAMAPSKPSPTLRDRLMTRIRPAAKPPHIVRADEGVWARTGLPGVTFKQLYVDTAQETITMLVRLAGGARYPAHHHAGPEHCLVIEGDVQIGDQSFGVGDYMCAAEDTDHGILSSRNGCVLLIIASQHDKLIT